MYKVFINEHLLKVCDQEENLERSSSELWIYDADNQEIKILIDWLHNESVPQQIILVYSSLLSGWKCFKECFLIIEAAGGLVKNNEGLTLLIYRLNKWDLPKGKLEEGESPQEAAIREVEEECNIDALRIIEPLPDTYHIYKLDDQFVLKRTFWFLMLTSSDKTLIPQSEEGIEQVKWMNADEVQMAALNTYPSLKGLLA